MVCEAQYGGKITDTLDRRLFKTYTQVWLNSNTCGDGFSFNPKQPIFKIPDNFVYKVADFDQITQWHSYIKTFPEIDSPEIFGLHPNADLTFRVKEVTALFNTLGETQPKGGGGGGDGLSREDVVADKAKEILGRMPEFYVEEEYKVKINKLGGLTVPLNIFLYQEVQRLQAAIHKVRQTFHIVMQAIRGEVVVTTEIMDSINAFFDARVPKLWLYRYVLPILFFKRISCSFRHFLTFFSLHFFLSYL
jgi:dynein heavy chain